MQNVNAEKDNALIPLYYNILKVNIDIKGIFTGHYWGEPFESFAKEEEMIKKQDFV